MSEKNFITILGLGNILLGDEGFGVHFIKWFSKRYELPHDVGIIDGGTLGYGLLDIVNNCEHLIVIDVIKTDDTPGSLYRFTRDDMEIHMPDPTSVHEVEFVDVLCMAELMDELPSVIFLGIVPQKYNTMDLEMTPLIKEKFPEMQRLLIEELALYNVSPEQIA